MTHARRRRSGLSRLGTYVFRVGGVLVVLGILTLCPVEAQQTEGAWEVKALVGVGGFLDSPTDYGFIIGGAVRKYLSSRIAVEPEFLYIREEEYRERYLVQVNLVRDFSGGGRFRPYLIGGLGIEHTREEFPGAREPFFSSNGVAGSGGVGTRIRLGHRFVVSPEFRIGTEPIVRATVSIGGASRR